MYSARVFALFSTHYYTSFIGMSSILGFASPCMRSIRCIMMTGSLSHSIWTTWKLLTFNLSSIFCMACFTVTNSSIVSSSVNSVNRVTLQRVGSTTLSHGLVSLGETKARIALFALRPGCRDLKKAGVSQTEDHLGLLLLLRGLLACFN